MGGERQADEADETEGSVDARPAPRERRPFYPGMRAVAIAASHVAKPIIVAKGGGTLARLKAEWAVIVGEEFSAVSWPEALSRDGGLRVRVLPGHALELQHRMPLLLDRINTFFGRPVASRLSLMQGAIPLRPPPARIDEPVVSAADSAALEGQLASVGDPELRERLERLGRAVIAAAGRAD